MSIQDDAIQLSGHGCSQAEILIQHSWIDTFYENLGSNDISEMFNSDSIELDSLWNTFSGTERIFIMSFLVAKLRMK